MKTKAKLIFPALIALATTNAFAKEYYTCESVQQLNGRSSDEELIISRGFFSSEIRKIKLVNEIDATKEDEVTENPFTTQFALTYRVYPEIIEEARNEEFVEYYERKTKIFLSRSLIDSEDTGYAFYYSESPWIFGRNTYFFYFKCRKN